MYKKNHQNHSYFFVKIFISADPIFLKIDNIYIYMYIYIYIDVCVFVCMCVCVSVCVCVCIYIYIYIHEVHTISFQTFLYGHLKSS